MKKPPQSVRLINLKYIASMSPGQLTMGETYVIYRDRDTKLWRIRERGANVLIAEGLRPDQVLEVLTKTQATRAN